MPVLAQDLRNAVLQAAMEGKLTKRIADDTLVLDSLDKIKQDRNNRISKKEIKNDKRLFDKVITVERFDIPDSWKWIRLGEVLYKLTDGAHKTPKYTSSGIKFVSVKDMSSGFLNLSNTKYISEKEHSELFSRCNPQKGDILLSKVGTTGVPAIVDTDEEFSLFVSVALLKFNDSLINKEYLYRVLQSPDVQQQAAENTKGIGNKNWVLDKIANTEIPLAPIEEQQRIVDKLNQIMPLIDEYEKLEKQLEELRKEFPVDMKQAILRAAMEGKLTEQFEYDTSPVDTLTLIKSEKEKLVKRKVIKKDQVYESFDEPYDIPNNWIWTNIGKVCLYSFSGKSPKYVKQNNGNYTLGQAANQNTGINFALSKFSTDEHVNNCKDFHFLCENDTLLNTLGGGSVGRVKILKNPNNYKCITDGHIFVFRTNGFVNEKYFYYYMKMNQKVFEKMAEGSTNQSFLKLNIIKNFPFPIAPIEEQQRIVDKLDQLLPLINDLGEMI